MGRKISSFKIGIFVLVCAFIGVGATVWLGISHLFEKTVTYVSYFDESVKGLQKDAIVNFRGIPMGRVKSLGVAPDGRLVEVIMGLQPSFRVSEDLSIRLKELGLTGMRYLEIDTAPAGVGKITPQITFPLKYPLINSSPSDFQELRVAFENLYANISAIDFKGLAEVWKEAAENVNYLLRREEIGDALGNFDEGSRSLKKAAQDASIFMEQLAKLGTNGNMKGGVKDLSASLVAVRKALEAFAGQMEGLPPNAFAGIAGDLEKITIQSENTISRWDLGVELSLATVRRDLQKLDAALSKADSLLESLKEQPSGLLYQSREPADPFDRRK